MSKRSLRGVVAACLGALLVVSLTGVAGASDRPVPPSSIRARFVPTHVLVGYAPSTMGSRTSIARSVGARQIRLVGAGTHVLSVPRGKVFSTIASLRRTAGVTYAEPDYIVHADTTTPTDPSFDQLWGLLNTGQTLSHSSGYSANPGTADADIDADQAWDLGTGSSSVVVGIVDTGVNYNHPDLAGNTWSNPGGVGNPACAAGTHGWNAIANTCDPNDDNEHGSHVSGTIGAAPNNGIGVAGINWDVSIMGLKFLGSNGSGSISDAIEAIDFAVNARQAYNANHANGANVVALNNSWGCSSSLSLQCFSQGLLDEINTAGNAGIVFVAAAGNNGRSLNGGAYYTYPCSFAAASEICVAATTQTDGLAAFSNYGTSYVNIGAPGTNIYSTVLGSGYDYFDGTSMATPHVTGSVALLAADCPSLTGAQLRSTILNTGDPDASLSGKVSTGDRLNVFNAVSTCAGGPPPSPDFSISASPASRTVTAGNSTSYTVTVSSINGYSGDVALSSGGYPANAGGTFTITPVHVNSGGSATSTLNVTTASNTPSGSSTITIQGADGSLTHSTTVGLTVQAPVQQNYSLTLSPNSRSLRHGQSTTYTVNITRSGGFTGAVSLSVSGLPSGATGSFSPASTTGSSSTLTIRTTSSATRGTFTFTVTGSGSPGTRTVNGSLRIR